MSPRTTGVLLLVALALGAFVWFYEIQGEAGREQAAAREKQLFPEVDPDDIEAIELTTRDGEEARLERGEDGFRLVKPLAFPADSFAADGLASNLADLEQDAVIDDPQPLAEYGLADGARVVRFTAGEQTYVLRLGDDAPVGHDAYASVEGRSEVYTVPRFAARSFDKSLAELRERRILDFDTASITRVELAWPEERVVLERAPQEASGGAWRMIEPVASRADDATVDRLLSDLAFLRAEGFVDVPLPDSAAGLAPPAFTATLTGPPPAEGAEAPALHIEIGQTHEGDQRLVRAGQPSLFTIPAARLDDVPRKVATYRYRRLTRFPAAEAHQVDLFFQPASGDPVAVSAVREDGRWTSSPESVAPGKLDRLVAELSDLEAADILAEAPDPAQLGSLGLSPPNVIVTVFGAVDEAEPAAGEPEAGEAAAPPALPRLAELHIGHVEGSEWIVVRAPGDATVYRLPYEKAESIPVSLDALRHRFTVEAGAGAEAEAPAGGAPEFLSPSQESP